MSDGFAAASGAFGQQLTDDHEIIGKHRGGDEQSEALGTFNAPKPDAVKSTPTPAGDFTMPEVFASDKDLVNAAPLARWPWKQILLSILLLIAAGVYVVWLVVLTKQRPMSDSRPFRLAL